MVSVFAPSSVASSSDTHHSKVLLNEMGTLREASKPFTQMIVGSGRTAVRLHCTIPTWSSSSDTCLDLHDLHELRSRALVFIHDQLQSLRSAGIAASYCLTPSDSSLCLLCALPPEFGTFQTKQAAINLLRDTKSAKRENVMLADLELGPCLIIT